MNAPKTITGKPFVMDSAVEAELRGLAYKVDDAWGNESLSSQILLDIYQQSKIDELYHSNRIEGNSLTYGETEEVVRADKEIYGKPIRDQQEARNLSEVLDYVHGLGADYSIAVTQNEIRRIHAILQRGIQADAGRYRTTDIKITGSKYVPPEAFQVPQHMTALSDYVKHLTKPGEPRGKYPIFSAAIAHTWLAQIHPFTDGNGRTARALMNLVLMRQGYPPCIITEEDRPRYIDALEESWAAGNVTALIELIYENVKAHLENRDWLRSVQARLVQAVSDEVEGEFRVWQNAMIYLKSQFRHTVDNLNAINVHGSFRWKFADYGELGIAKYDALRRGVPAQKTRHFGVEIAGLDSRGRYVFYFANAAEAMGQYVSVVLMIAKDAGSDKAWLDDLAKAPPPRSYQIGFDLGARKFVVFGAGGMRVVEASDVVRQFFEAILPLDSGSN